MRHQVIGVYHLRNLIYRFCMHHQVILAAIDKIAHRRVIALALRDARVEEGEAATELVQDGLGEAAVERDVPRYESAEHAWRKETLDG
jgi:hypothetical protein